MHRLGKAVRFAACMRCGLPIAARQLTMSAVHVTGLFYLIGR
jgi:hypothetical protein